MTESAVLAEAISAPLAASPASSRPSATKSRPSSAIYRSTVPASAVTSTSARGAPGHRQACLLALFNVLSHGFNIAQHQARFQCAQGVSSLTSGCSNLPTAGTRLAITLR
jgi:hypothetical protein